MLAPTGNPGAPVNVRSALRPPRFGFDRGRPTEQCRREGMPSLSEAPSGGAKPFASFLAFEKGSRRKGETISGRYRSNGYALRQQISHRASCDAPRITVAHGSINAFSAERGASLAAFPRRARERSATGDSGSPVKVGSALRPPRFAVARRRPVNSFRSEHAPGGVPTMEVNDDAGSLTPRGALRFFASMLAPTEPAVMGQENQKPNQQPKRGGLTADLIAGLFAFPLWEILWLRGSPQP